MSHPIGFAHRGASADASENTLAAFRLALERGATGLESDVWVTADGVAVLDHDGVVGERPIGELSRAALPPHIPSLAELYDACGADYELSLDVKHPAAAEPAVEVARSAGELPRLWLCHWNWRVVAGWRALSDEVRLVDSTRARHMSTPPTERAARMRSLRIDAINLHGSDWTPALAAPFREAGIRVFGWDAQEVEMLERLLRLPVDGLYSDHVDRMMLAIHRHRAERL